MRQSLSAAGAVVLSVVLAVAAIVDQAGGRSLAEHASAMYEPYGKDPNAGLLYGLVYAIAIVDLVLFLLVLRGARQGTRTAGIVAVVAMLLTGSLALTLLLASEYGQRMYPSQWGLLALLPPVAGGLSAVQLLRGRPRRADVS